MDKLSTFTSTGIKLIHHPDVLTCLKKGQAKPVSLQVAPTSRCNLNCSFCSNVNREKHEDLDFQNLKCFIYDLIERGLKTVEITGGGDPTMYKHINQLIEFCHSHFLEVGMISNGVLLKEAISQKNLDKLKWLRVSLNSLEHYGDIDIPEIKGSLGFSFVVHEGVLASISNYTDVLEYYKAKYKPSYIRIVPDCLPNKNEKEIDRECYSLMLNLEPVSFYQRKLFKKPEKCYWGYLKPFLLHDGFVYPCSSVVLNTGSDGTFHERYRLDHMIDFPVVYNNAVAAILTNNCDRCVFTNQNNLVDSIMNPNGMENFI